jgi:hypothetical protein
VLAAGGGVAVLTWPAGGVATFMSDEPAAALPPVAVPAAAPAAKPSGIRIDQVDLGKLGRKFSLPQRPTEKFSMVSVSWNSPKDAPDGTVQVRTRSARTGQWTGWKSLSIAEDAADLAGERSRVRGRTAPLWTGPSDGVAARLVGAAAKPLPAGLLLKLIDPNAQEGGRGGGEPAPTPTTIPKAPPPALVTGTPIPEATTTTTKPPATTVAPPTTTATSPAPTTTVPPGVPKPPMPAYVSRAGWKANESLVKAPPTIAQEGVKLVWVHHTGTEFPKTCADAPDFVRAIMATDISEGFDDIGYNFLVDNCGTIYEGRKGGVTNAVVGAHVAGFNTGTAGIALIGDYTKVRPSNAALTSIAKLAASRLGAYGNDPTGTTTLVAGIDGMKWPKGTVVTFPRIAGHRDGAETECPGDLFYPLLGQIRGRAALPGLAITSVTGGEPTTGPYYLHDKGQVHWTVGGDPGRISRFDVLVDSKVVTTSTTSSAPITVSPGSHNVAVRVVHETGATDITPVTKVIGDVTNPTFPTAPWVALKTGTYSATSVPVAVNFKSADDNGKIARQQSLSPNQVSMLGTSTLWNATVKPNVAVTYSVRAQDMAYNQGVSTVSRTIVQMPETSAKRTGTWSTRSAATTYLGGQALAASAKNAKLAYTFNGRSAALTFSRTPATGQATILVDGVKVATVDTKAAATSHRQTIWVKALTAGVHTVSVVVVGTSGRPTVISDGLTYVK